MYSHRQNLDIELLLDKNSNQNRIRPPTPLKKVPLKITTNKQNTTTQNNQWQIQLNNNRNIDDISHKLLLIQDTTTKIPLISPVKKPFKNQIQKIYGQDKKNNKPVAKINKIQTQTQNHYQLKNCVNHPNKSAQFIINIEDQCLTYCQKCAAQLASQGFQVTRIQSVLKKPDPHPSQPKTLPKYPKYQGNHKYQLIIQFLTQLATVQNQHLQNMTKLSQIDEHYLHQIQYTKNYYQQLFQFLQQMKQDHLNDLYQSNKKHSQLADIQHDYLQNNIDQINNIRNDIENNLQIIIQKLQKQDLKNNLNFYKQKLLVYQHKIQQLSQFFTQIINFQQQQYQSKLLKVQNFLINVWNIPTTQQNKFVQNLIQIQKKPSPSHKQSDFIIKPLPKINNPSQNINKSPTVKTVPQNQNLI